MILFRPARSLEVLQDISSKVYLSHNRVLQKLPYSGKFSREKCFMNYIHRKNFRELVACATKGCHTPYFVEKTFANSHKTSKFAKVFTLKRFPLYGSECLPSCIHLIRKKSKMYEGVPYMNSRHWCHKLVHTNLAPFITFGNSSPGSWATLPNSAGVHTHICTRLPIPANPGKSGDFCPLTCNKLLPVRVRICFDPHTLHAYRRGLKSLRGWTPNHTSE